MSSLLFVRGNLILQNSSPGYPGISPRHSTVFDEAVHLAKKDAKVTQLGDTPTLGLYKGRESSEDDLRRCCGESEAGPERPVRCSFVMIVVKEGNEEEKRFYELK